MQQNNLPPLTMNQLMIIQHLNDNQSATKKELDSIEIHKNFKQDINQATTELISLGFIRKCVKSNRPAFEMV